MQSNVWKKSVLIIGSLFLVFSLVNIVGAGMGSQSDQDSVITSMVMDKLQNDIQLRGDSINVETINGEVTLKGLVKSQEDINRAGQLAGWVDGVKKVDNRLNVEKKYESSTYHGSGRAADCPVGANWNC
ncbi:MAG: BON domain-containing protein [Hyphomicrobiales bacterium]